MPPKKSRYLISFRVRDPTSVPFDQRDRLLVVEDHPLGENLLMAAVQFGVRAHDSSK